MPMKFRLVKLCSTTWTVETFGNVRIGTVNYPGNHPTNNFHAIIEKYKVGDERNDLGHFITLPKAVDAIVNSTMPVASL